MAVLNRLLRRERRGDLLSFRDMEHLLYSLRCRRENVYYGFSGEEEGLEDIPPMYACKFNPTPGRQHWLAMADEDGCFGLLDTTREAAESGCMRGGFHAHNNCIFDLSWLPGEQKIVTVSGDQSAVVWDVQTFPYRAVNWFYGHTRSVKCVATAPCGNGVLATGGRDAAVFVWDSRKKSPTPENHIKAHTSQDQKMGHGSVTDIAFWDDFRLISSGATDGESRVWDLRKSYSVYTRAPMPLTRLTPHGKPIAITSLALDQSQSLLYTSCMDNHIYRYNLASPSIHPDVAYHGHRVESFYIKICLSPCSGYLLSGSSNGKPYVWSVNSRDPLVELDRHFQEVSCVAWCPAPGLPRMITCGDDLRTRKWEVLPEDYDNVERAQVPEKLDFCHCDRWFKPDEPVKRVALVSRVVPQDTVSPIRSMVADLPNLVLDSPPDRGLRHRAMHKQGPMDWLTRMGRQRKLKFASTLKPQEVSPRQSSPSPGRTPKSGRKRRVNNTPKRGKISLHQFFTTPDKGK